MPPTTSSEGWEVADGVAHQSEELAGLPVLRPLRQGVPTRRLGMGLCPLPAKWRRARGRRPKFRRHREVGTRPVARRTGRRTRSGNSISPGRSGTVYSPKKVMDSIGSNIYLASGTVWCRRLRCWSWTDLRGRFGARTKRLSPGTQRARRRSQVDGCSVGTWRGDRRGPVWILRQYPACRVNEIGVPADSDGHVLG